MVLGILLGLLAVAFAIGVPATALYYGEYKFQRDFIKKYGNRYVPDDFTIFVEAGGVFTDRRVPSLGDRFESWCRKFFY